MEHLFVAKMMNSNVVQISIVYPGDCFVPQPASAMCRICPNPAFDHSLSGVLTWGSRSENSLIQRITNDCWENDDVLEDAVVDGIEERWGRKVRLHHDPAYIENNDEQPVLCDSRRRIESRNEVLLLIPTRSNAKQNALGYFSLSLPNKLTRRPAWFFRACHKNSRIATSNERRTPPVHRAGEGEVWQQKLLSTYRAAPRRFHRHWWHPEDSLWNLSFPMDTNLCLSTICCRISESASDSIILRSLNFTANRPTYNALLL